MNNSPRFWARWACRFGLLVIASGCQPPSTEPAHTPAAPMVEAPAPSVGADDTTTDDNREPGALDLQKLAVIEMTLHSWGCDHLDWARWKQEGKAILPYFERIIADPENEDRIVFRAMIFANENLTKYDCKRLVEPVVGHLKNHNWEVRSEAIALLRLIGGKADCVPVVVLLYHDDNGVDMCAAWCLEKLGGKRELLALDLWLRDESRLKVKKFDEVKKYRDALRERLEKEAKAKSGEPTEADKAVAKFADADAKVRVAAVEALRKVGSRADSTAVVALLHDPDATVRTAAAEWLGAVGGKRELVALEIRLREPKATDDAAFDAVAKAKRAVAERVEADEKKLKDKPPAAKGGK